jgi:hypothetical protein
MRLCSIRRTHYCSLGRSISSCCRGPGMAGSGACSVQVVEDGSVLTTSSQTGTGGIQENGWSRTYRKAARTRGPSGSWATTSCRKGHKRGIRASVQWGQARAGAACRRNEGSVSGGEQRQPLYVEVNNSSSGGADLSGPRAATLLTICWRCLRARSYLYGVRRSAGGAAGYMGDEGVGITQHAQTARRPLKSMQQPP